MRNGKSANLTPFARPARHGRSRRHAFTMLELMVVIGIIVVLLAMSIIGFRHVQASAARNRTRVAMHDLEGMVAELDRTGGMVRLVMPPSNSPTPVPGPAYASTTATLAAFNYVTADGDGRVAAINACLWPLSILLIVPANQQALAQLPADSLIPGSMTTVNGVQVTAVSDGWGNPIIYVPAGGLTGVFVGATSTSSGVTYTNPPVTITSPDNRPFWASAGPDGNFANGDDNIYSFEK